MSEVILSQAELTIAMGILRRKIAIYEGILVRDI